MNGQMKKLSAIRMLRMELLVIIPGKQVEYGAGGRGEAVAVSRVAEELNEL